VAPASDAEIMAAEVALGQALPSEIKQIYAVTRSIPSIISPPDKLRIMSSFSEWEMLESREHEGDDEERIKGKEDEALWFEPLDGSSERSLKLNDKVNLLRLEHDGLLLFDVGTSAALQGIRVYHANMMIAPDLVTMLRGKWVDLQISELLIRERNAEAKVRASAFLASSTEQLIKASQYQPPFWLRLFQGAVKVQAGATESDLAQLSQRLNRALPNEHQHLLLAQNGIETLNLLSSNAIAPMSASVKYRRNFLGALSCAIAEPCPNLTLTPEMRDSCLVVAGHIEKDPSTIQMASLLWCPMQTQPHIYVDGSRNSFRSINEWLAWRAGNLAPYQ
jgi:hypothetical protein